MKKYIAVCMMATLGLSCNTHRTDYPDEDYGKLFPFGGIEKPETSYDDLTEHLCNPHQIKESFVYPGVDGIQHVRDYVVTLTCSFKELKKGVSSDLADPDKVESRYIVRYITPDKELHEVSTSPRATGERMLNNQEYTISFTAQSGYPMYLGVSGVGPRSSAIKASISAVSKDGLTVVNPLKSEQVQLSEGIDQLRYPFCEFIILP